MVDVLSSVNIRTVGDLAEYNGGRRGLVTSFDLSSDELNALDYLVRTSGLPTEQWFG